MFITFKGLFKREGTTKLANQSTNVQNLMSNGIPLNSFLRFGGLKFGAKNYNKYYIVIMDDDIYKKILNTNDDNDDDDNDDDDVDDDGVDHKNDFDRMFLVINI